MGRAVVAVNRVAMGAQQRPEVTVNDDEDSMDPDEAAWDEVLARPTQAAVEAFLEAWHASDYAEAARDLLARFRADAVDVEPDAHWTAVLAQSLQWGIRGFDGGSLAGEVLMPWAHELVFVRRWLDALRQRPGSPVPAAHQTELVALFQLDQVAQALLPSFQQTCAECAGTGGARITRGEYVDFFLALGFEVLDAPAFSAVFHEIVVAHAAPARDAPITLLRELWPGLTLGPMVFSRAGVEVSGGAEVLDPELATTSMLYWTNHRCRRPCDDLSMGWGANSSFYTEFRRDLVIGGKAYLQVDAPEDSDPQQREFTLAQWQEFMLHRCFVRTKHESEPWGYETRVVLDLQDTLGR
jgi:hypothetical protein